MPEHPHSPTYSDDPAYYQVGGWGDQWRTDVISAVDWLGHTFKVGDKVMYCISAGRGQMMAIGEVKQIRARQEPRYRWENHPDPEQTGRQRVLTGHVDVVEVQVLTERTSGGWNNKERTKPAWVNPMNITSLANIND